MTILKIDLENLPQEYMNFDVTGEDLNRMIMFLEGGITNEQDSIDKEKGCQDWMKPENRTPYMNELTRLQRIFYNLLKGREKLKVTEVTSRSDARFTITNR